MKQSPNEGLCVNLSYDDEKGMFLISYFDGETALFQVSIAPASFEKMTNDMLRTVKNYNLFMAQQYLERKNEKEEGTPDASECLNFAGGLPDPCCENTGCET